MMMYSWHYAESTIKMSGKLQPDHSPIVLFFVFIEPLFNEAY